MLYTMRTILVLIIQQGQNKNLGLILAPLYKVEKAWTHYLNACI